MSDNLKKPVKSQIKADFHEDHARTPADAENAMPPSVALISTSSNEAVEHLSYEPFIEDFGAEANIPEPLADLEAANREISGLRDELHDLLQYAKTGQCSDEECSDLNIFSANGVELFNRLKTLYGDALVSSYLARRNIELEDENALLREQLQAFPVSITSQEN